MADDTGFCLWFTGYSGAGKSTIANVVADELRNRGRRVELLDGDEVREHLSAGLTFSKTDRDINIRRIGWVAKVLARNGVAAITAAISPYRETRDEVRRLAAAEGIPFVEVHADASIDALVLRDVKGLYAKAITGEIAHFTGISDPYEPPHDPEIVAHTDRETVAASLGRIQSVLDARGLLPRGVRGVDALGAAIGGAA